MRDTAPQDGQGIVFAPVIKIVNGNDNSTNDEPDKPKQPNEHPEHDKFSTPLIKHEEPKKDIEVKKTKEPETSSGGGLFDFANLVIKKMT